MPPSWRASAGNGRSLRCPKEQQLSVTTTTQFKWKCQNKQRQTTTNNNSPTPKDRPGGGEHHPHAPSCGGDLLGWITCVMTAFVHSRVHAVRKSNSREPSENVLPGPGELPLYHLSPRLSVRTGLTTRLFPQKFHFPPPKPGTKTMQPLHWMKVLCGARRHSLHSATLTKSTKNPW